MQLTDLSACALREAFATGSVSPVEILMAVKARAERLEPQIAALWAADFEEAAYSAQASQKRWRAGTPLGPVDGIPLTVKENIATKGLTMPLGTAASDFLPALADAPPVARAKESGAVLFARTTMPDYGMLSSSLSSFHALTRNPWNMTKTPGGSSSGAGAAAAAGYGPLHLGTDIGGSLRLPAGWCGIFTLKPSLGRIPIDPPFTGRCAGPMTRCVADAALFMQVLSRPDARDYTSLPYENIDWNALDRDPKGLRIGLLPDAGAGLPVDPDIRRAVEAAALAFAQAGAHVDVIKPFLTRAMLDGQDRFWRARACAEIAPLPEERKAKILPFILAWAMAARVYSGQQVYDGFAQSMAIQRATIAATTGYDFILSPVAPVTAFTAEKPCPTDDPDRPFEHIAFTLPCNISQQPAASINCGYSATGLPIGLQIAGRRFDDLGVLQMSRFWEKIRPQQHCWPEPV